MNSGIINVFMMYPLMCWNATGFYVLAILPHFYSNKCSDFFVFAMKTMGKNDFISSLPIPIPFIYFSYLTVQTRTSSMTSNSSGSDHSCPLFQGSGFNVLP